MLNLEITTNIGCRNACNYCPQDRLIEAYGKRSNIMLMSFDSFKLFISTVPPDVNIVFSGFSEPWLNPECTKMLLYAHRKGHGIVANTTLIGLAPQDIALIKGIPFRSFSVHLPSQEKNEQIPVDEHYLETLGMLSKSKIKASYHFFGKDVEPRIKTFLKKKIGHRNALTRAGNIKIKGISGVKMKKRDIKCLFNLGENVLLPNGDVALCCLDFGLQHILGNLSTCDYPSLFYSEAFLGFKRKIKNEESDILCRHCEIANVSLPNFWRWKGFWYFKNTYRLRFLRRYLDRVLSGINIFNLFPNG